MKLSKKKFVNIVIYILFFFSLPALLSYLWVDTENRKPPFDSQPLEEINKRKPRFVFIGNSMLGTRIERILLGELTGARIYYIIVGGASAPYWYLALKNYVTAAEPTPQKVFIFFRDHILTRPLFQLRGQSKEKIDLVSQKKEITFSRVVADTVTFKGHLKTMLKRIYPAADSTSKNRHILSSIAWKLSVHRKKRSLEKFLKILNLRFGWYFIRNDRKKQKITPTYDDKHLDFQQCLNRSFLPHMIQLAKENNIRLVFIRIQKRPFKKGQPPPQNKKLKNYISDLRNYILENNMGFHDFTGDPKIRRSMYGSGDHIADKYRPKYTKIFYARLKEEFR